MRHMMVFRVGYTGVKRKRMLCVAFSVKVKFMTHRDLYDWLPPPRSRWDILFHASRSETASPFWKSRGGVVGWLSTSSSWQRVSTRKSYSPTCDVSDPV